MIDVFQKPTMLMVLCIVLVCSSMTPAVTLSGRVYEGNTGIEPPEAKPLAGVTVNLYGADNAGQMGTYITHTTTDGNGWYSLWFSTRGDKPVYDYYNIVVTTPAGYTSEGATSVSGSVEATDWIQYEFDWLTQTTTGNKFWLLPEAVEPENGPPVANDDSITILRDSPVEVPVLNNDSDPDGDAIIIQTATDPPHGETPIIYPGSSVVYQPDPGFIGTDTFEYTIIDGRGGTDTATVTVYVVDESPEGTGTIRGTKFNDLDENGERSPSEPGLASWQITLEDGDGNLLAAATTDADGNYAFSGLQPGAYRVDEVQQSGWRQTYPEVDGQPAVWSIGLEPEEVMDDVDFGNTEEQTPPEVPEGEWDFGDAPEGRIDGNNYNYPTTLANNGARHRIVAVGPWLGYAWDRPDAEPDGQPNIYANGDDINGRDDEILWFGAGFPYPGRVRQGTIRVLGGGGYVDAWLDFNRDGTWQHPQERIISQFLPDGDNHISYEVPTDAVPGTTYCRIRINSKGPLPPYGPADDGAVSDIKTTIFALDYGDAPDPPYPTLESSGGPWVILWDMHAFYFGAHVDGDLDGQPDPNALGDDNDGIDDDDGVTFITKLIPGQQATVEVIVSRMSAEHYISPLEVHAWIDFDQNGSWEASEIIIRESAFDFPGTCSFTVPSGALLGTTYARFTFGSTGPDPTNSSSHEGEIEDYEIVIGEDGPYPPSPASEWDFGDAPDSYGTLRTSNGASHIVVGGACLGALVDAEPDGQPTANATGDDLAGINDDDGVTWLAPLVRGRTAQVRITGEGSDAWLRVLGWIDFNQDHDWSDPGEKIVDWAPFGGMPGFSETFTFTVPADAVPGHTFARFRINLIDTTLASPVGPGGVGEVEDYQVYIMSDAPGPEDNFDFGDAPHDGINSFYPTRMADNGAYHEIDLNYVIGSGVDGEQDGQPDDHALGDDTHDTDDEDGLTFTTPLLPGQQAFYAFTARAERCALVIWIDFNRDGVWQHPGERIAYYWGWFNGPLSHPFDVPANAVVGRTFARIRLAEIDRDLHTTLGPYGYGGKGEVEDYEIWIGPGGPLPPSGGDGQICGSKWNDLDGDGSPDAGEPWLANWRIYLDTNSNRRLDAGEPSQLTEANGSFEFTGLAVGSYVVAEEMPPGWTQTWPGGAGTHTINIQSGVQPACVLFGNQYTGGATQQLDYGDAPDPTYPTLLANNGASHRVVDGFHLGANIDPELDGQPSPDAQGDNGQGINDEDGILFVTPLLSGEQALVEVTASAPGCLDAWIDFDADGGWNQAHDRIFTSQVIQSGTNLLSFPVPTGSAIDGDTYARFRFSSDCVPSPAGPALDGEVEDYRILLGEEGPGVPGEGEEPPHVKWSQPPIENAPNVEEPPVFCGWDEPARSPQFGDSRWQWRMNADDFRCLGSIPITRIRWWGGYKGWRASELPEPQPEAWHVGFWANQVEGLEPDELYLERLVWSVEVPDDRVCREPAGLSEFPESLSETCFVYELQLEPEEWFHQAEFPSNEGLFWISITAIYPPDVEAVNQWGWLTRPSVWRDGAVMPAIMGEWPTGEERLFPGRIYPIERDSLCEHLQPYDLCFELLTERPWTKWDQPFVGLRQWPGYSDHASIAFEPPYGALVVQRQVADDWPCESVDPVTAIAWQGSYLGYGYEACKCDETVEPRRPDYFLLSISADAPPAGQGHERRPGEKVWEYAAYDYDEVLVGYDREPEGEPNEAVFRYSVRLPAEAWFQQAAQETVFWFSVMAVFKDTTTQIPYYWGWTSHEHTFGSAAMAINYDGGSPRWQEILDDGVWPIDMSFTLFTVPQSGALAHWRFDETEGNIAADSVGGHSGAVHGATWTQGAVGGALRFDGDDYVEVVDETDFDLTEAVTVAAWVNLEAVNADWIGMVTKGDSTWRLSTFQDERRFHFAVNDQLGSHHSVDGSTRVGLNEWHHLVGTYDGSLIRLFVDGVEDPASSVAYTGPINVDDFPVWIGANAQRAKRGFVGRIDEVVVYDRALTHAEILDLMALAENVPPGQPIPGR